MLPSASSCKSAFSPSYALVSLSKTTTSTRSISHLLFFSLNYYPSILSLSRSRNSDQRIHPSAHVSGMSCRHSPRNDFCFSLNHPDDQAGSAVGTQPEVLESMRHASSG